MTAFFSDEKGLTHFQSRLLDWYRRHKRELPWRDLGNPYAVLVSEMMLQQTQVATVIPYFERFMERFPTPQALADAPTDDVLHLWQGLGYYSRARNLQKAAQDIVTRFGGRVPKNVEALLSLPGVGRYTAGAVASIGFNEPAPILDGNIIRALTRLFCVGGDPKSSATQRTLWELAERLVPSDDARDFNTGLMELGSLVCMPTRPQCGACPVADDCRARQRNEVARFPEVAPRQKTVSVEEVAVFVKRDGYILLTKRPKGELWEGLWELPRVRREEGERLDATATRAASEVCDVQVAVGELFGSVKHSVTRYRIHLRGFRAKWVAGEGVPQTCAAVAWVPRDDLPNYALSSPQRRLTAMALTEELQYRLVE